MTKAVGISMLIKSIKNKIKNNNSHKPNRLIHVETEMIQNKSNLTSHPQTQEILTQIISSHQNLQNLQDQKDVVTETWMIRSIKKVLVDTTVGHLIEINMTQIIIETAKDSGEDLEGVIEGVIEVAIEVDTKDIEETMKAILARSVRIKIAKTLVISLPLIKYKK